MLDLSVHYYSVMIPLRFVVSVDGAMGHGSAFLQCLTNGSSFGLESALCSDCLPSSTDLSQGIVCVLV